MTLVISSTTPMPLEPAHSFAMLIQRLIKNGYVPAPERRPLDLAIVACGLPSLWFLLEPLTRRASASEWLIDLVIFAVFAFTLVWGYRRASKYPLRVIAAMTALAFAASPFNATACLFLVYASGFVGAFGNMRLSLFAVGGILLATVLQAWMLNVGIAFTFGTALLVVSVSAYSIYAAVRQGHNESLKIHRDEIARLARIAERERIARDLHDSVGHSLSTLVIKLRLAEKLITREPQQAAEELAELQQVAQSTLSDIRDLVHGYDNPGLLSAIENGRLALKAAGVDVRISVSHRPMDSASEQAMTQALREAITNVIRHAKAKTCSIELMTVQDQVRLTITDDGGGSVDAGGFGLRSMRGRIEGVEGTFDFDDQHGTRIMMTVPVGTQPGVA